MANIINRGYNYEVLRTPIITEKSMKLSENGKFVFKVASFATKQDVKNAIQSLFKVNVISVNMINTKGKTKVFKGIKGFRNGSRKAIITLKSGENIDLGVGV